MAIKLEDAVAVVQKEIRKWREKYESVANENGQDHSIIVESKTTAGYFCQLIVNPQEVAKIFVDYDYALYRVLGKDAPDAMWEDLGRKFGLEHVLLGGSMKASQKRHKCPKCGKYYAGYPALSRADNKTEIYPECGDKRSNIIF